MSFTNRTVEEAALHWFGELGYSTAYDHTRYTYDKNYSMASFTNAPSNTTSYTDAVNELLEAVTDPLSRTWTFEHDPAGILTKTTYSSGSTAVISHR